MHFVYITDRLTTMIRTYKEMISFPTFKERFDYLKLNGVVGESTFGFHRIVNQSFYSSREWRSIRSKVIIRDDGCDLGVEDRPINDRVHIHHLNPVTLEQLEDNSSMLYDLDNLVCVSYATHLAIHYGDDSILFPDLIERTPGDTKLW